MRGSISISLVVAVSMGTCAGAQESAWAHAGADGRLVYKTTPRGDRMVDFSYAGYMGGGVRLPQVAAGETLAPSGVDDTAAVQQALERTAARAAKDGHTVALELAAGEFHLSAALRMESSHVVLRGAGPTKTILRLTGTPHMGITIGPGTNGSIDEGSEAASAPKAGNAKASTTLAEIYVPSGAQEIRVVDATGFAAGDTVLLTRSINAAYLAFMGMDKLVRGGSKENWVGPRLIAERQIASVRDNVLVLAVPLTDSYDPQFGGGAGTRVEKIPAPKRLQQVGVEELAIDAPSVKIDLADPHYDGIAMGATEDAWMRNLRFEDTINTVSVLASARRVTVDRVSVLQRIPIQSSAKNFVFSLAGTQTLLMHVEATGDKVFFVATQAREQGPNVVLASRFQGDLAIQPHQRWGTGFLVDNVIVTGGGDIDFMNRGILGSGHGWTMGWGVVWNSSANSLTVQAPPGAMNWLIGTSGHREARPMPAEGEKGANLPEGTVESPNKRVTPASLYLQQLRDRLGPQAVQNMLQ